jgi:nicotinamidase-related amidase
MSWQPLPTSVTVTYNVPQPRAFELDPAKTALVIVDMENAFCTPGFQFYFTRMEATIAGNARLLAKARAAGVKIIYSQSVRKPDMVEVIRFGRDAHLLEGTPDVQIIPALAPRPGEIVFKKYSHDPFARTGFDELLEREGVVEGEWSVLVTGVSAAVCANVCALGFANRHYYTIIPMDCTAARSVTDEARTYAQYTSAAYEYCIGFTTSELVTFVPGAGQLKPIQKELVKA